MYHEAMETAQNMRTILRVDDLPIFKSRMLINANGAGIVLTDKQNLRRMYPQRLAYLLPQRAECPTLALQCKPKQGTRDLLREIC